MSTEIEPADEGMTAVTPGQLLIGGTFAIYPTASGGLVLVTDVEGRGVERKEIPKAVVSMFMGKGAMGAMARKMFGGNPPIEPK